MVCRDFILPEPASYVFFYAIFNLRNLLYIICGHRPAGKADQNTAQAVGLYAPSPGGHGVLDHRQTNRVGKKYREETL